MQVNFCYGKQEQIENYPITPGSLYVVTDTQRIYFDSAEGSRIEMGELEALTENEIDALLV